ncbi:MAG: tRNA lysidine(34) synthetase TilS [Polyangiales bacterium]
MLRARVQRTIIERELLSRGDHVLAACSGGADSMALVHVLQALAPSLGITVFVASVDHGLRVEAADEVVHVGRFAESLKLGFFPLKVNVPSDQPSLQSEARRARYQSLLELGAVQGATAIALGHTQDDQAETVLSRLLRGGSIRGLRGVLPRRADGVVRPLIDCTRQDVQSYCDYHGLPFLEDPSNTNRAFERVRIRHDLLPHLRSENAQIAQHLAALADDAEAVVAAVDSWLDEFNLERDELEPRQYRDHPLRSMILSRWIERRTGVAPSRRQLNALEQVAAPEHEVWLAHGVRVSLRNGRLALFFPADLNAPHEITSDRPKGGEGPPND